MKSTLKKCLSIAWALLVVYSPVVWTFQLHLRENLQRITRHKTHFAQDGPQTSDVSDPPIGVDNDASGSSSHGSDGELFDYTSQSVENIDPSDESSHQSNTRRSTWTQPDNNAITPRTSFLQNPPDLSRREWLQWSAAAGAGTVIVAATSLTAENITRGSSDLLNKKLNPVNLTRVFQETTINVTVQGPPLTAIALDPRTFEKKQQMLLPTWVPAVLVPKPRVIGEVTNAELLSAAVVAGSAMEMARTSLLYPLMTLKTRVQSDINKNRKQRNHPVRLGARWRLSIMTMQKHLRQGNLYAGLRPALLITVPATGLFYGTRDVVKRMLVPMFPEADIPVLLTAAFCGDVIALAFRTPADTLSVRMQQLSGLLAKEEKLHSDNSTQHYFMDPSDDSEREKQLLDEQVGNWFSDACQRLPAVILTDLPYLLLRVWLNRSFLHGQSVDVGRYGFTVVCTAILCAFVTTPFDVARTRILIDTDTGDDRIDGGSGEGVLRTFKTIYNEGDGGIRNLFAGCWERTAYLGLGRACLEPLQLIGYIALRDFILLEFFD